MAFDFTPYFGENGLFKPTENTTMKEKEMNTKNDPVADFMDMVFGPVLKNGSFKVMCNGKPVEMPAKLAVPEHVPGMQAKFPGIKRVQFNLKTTDFKRDLNAEPRTIMVKGQKKVVHPYAKDENGKKIQIDIDPVLATIVYFKDGTKAVVQNSKTDKVVLEDVALADGTVVKTASAQSKELAVIYAIVKRLFGSIDKLGNVVDTGLARKLGDIVANAYDTNVEAAKTRIAEAARKAAARKAQKPAKKRYSLAETLARFNAILDKAEAGDPDAKAVVDGVMA